MDNTNGLMICDNKYLPLELLTKIFYHVGNEILLKCHLVCKLWRATIQEFVWREKAKLHLGQFPHNKNIPWQAFYLICKKKPFERNLLKNHSGERNNGENWKIFDEVDSLKIENPPGDVPELPNVPIFEGIHSCFTPSFFFLGKHQYVDLIAEGIDPYILDNYQPPIMVSHVFENYGYGLREILFFHSITTIKPSLWICTARDRSIGKMAGACVRLQIPSTWEIKLELHDLF